MFVFLVSIIGQIHDFLYGLDPAMLDIAKIFVGSLVWIGGFVVFVRLKEKNKKIQPSMIRIESIK